jgi:AcrR family transcriptional regulator
MNETVVQPGRDTKTRILDAAERLMGHEGFDVALRAITAEAGVNLAAVNYHFQSKDALLDAIIARRIAPLNQRRLEMLDRIEAEFPSGPLPLERVLDAFFRPMFESAGEMSHIRPLLGRIYSAPAEFLNRVFSRHLAEAARRFAGALQRAVPELPREEIFWRLQFSAGMMVHIMNWASILPAVTNGLCDVTDGRRTADRLVAFATAGFRAPLPNRENRS